MIFLLAFFTTSCRAPAAPSAAVTLDYSGTSSVAVDLNSGPSANSTWLSSPKTTISLPYLDVGSGPDEGLYVGLFSRGTALTNAWCKWGVRGMWLFRSVAVPGKRDRIYLYHLVHGDSMPNAGKQTLTCGWDNASLAAVGAVSFKGVQTWPAQMTPAVSINTGFGTDPRIDIPSAPNHMTLAFMMHDTSVATSLSLQSQTLQWAISNMAPNGAATTAPGGTGSIVHRFTLGVPLPWVVVGIDIPNQPVNIVQRWLVAHDDPLIAVQSLTMQNFHVGAGSNEYMVVGITSPAPLANLRVTWDAACSGCSQDLFQVDAFPIPGDTVAFCTHGMGTSTGGWSCDTYGANTQAYLYWYGLKLPHAGNKLLRASWTNNLVGTLVPLIDAMALSFANVNQSTPYQNISHANGSVTYGGQASLQVTSGGSGNMTVALIGNGGGVTWCNPTRTSNAPSTGHGIDFASSRALGPLDGGIVTHTWTWGKGPADNHNTCSNSSGPTYAVLYGVSGFDIVSSGSSPPR